jgi:hypothetical protein
VLAFLFVEHLDGARVLLLNVGLDDLGDRLSLGDVITDHDADRRQPAGGRRSRFDDAAAAADQDSLTGGAGRDAPDDTPGHRRDEGNANDEDDDPVERSGDADEVIKLLGRCGALQRHGAKRALRHVAHVPGPGVEPGTASSITSSRWFCR